MLEKRHTHHILILKSELVWLQKTGRFLQDENAGYSSTNCAERTAFFKAVSEGVQEFDSITIIGGSEKKGIQDFCPPCGVCLQVMMEFCDPEKFQIILAKSNEEYQIYTLKDLLPHGFGRANLS